MVYTFCHTLRRSGFHTLLEVGAFERSIDIVAWKPEEAPGFTAWEAKLRPSLHVLTQALAHRIAAPHIGIVVPAASADFRRIAGELGFGVVEFPYPGPATIDWPIFRPNTAIWPPAQDSVWRGIRLLEPVQDLEAWRDPSPFS
jgi:hypothetical protein